MKVAREDGTVVTGRHPCDPHQGREREHKNRVRFSVREKEEMVRET